MQCDTCKQESAIIMRVVIAKDYNRSLARPVFNCPSCFDQKEQQKRTAPRAQEPHRSTEAM